MNQVISKVDGMPAKDVERFIISKVTSMVLENRENKESKQIRFVWVELSYSKGGKTEGKSPSFPSIRLWGSRNGCKYS